MHDRLFPWPRQKYEPRDRTQSPDPEYSLSLSPDTELSNSLSLIFQTETEHSGQRLRQRAAPGQEVEPGVCAGGNYFDAS